METHIKREFVPPSEATLQRVIVQSTGIKVDKECCGAGTWQQRERGHRVLKANRMVHLLACVKAQKGPTRANRSSS